MDRFGTDARGCVLNGQSRLIANRKPARAGRLQATGTMPFAHEVEYGIDRIQPDAHPADFPRLVKRSLCPDFTFQPCRHAIDPAVCPENDADGLRDAGELRRAAANRAGELLTANIVAISALRGNASPGKPDHARIQT